MFTQEGARLAWTICLIAGAMLLGHGDWRGAVLSVVVMLCAVVHDFREDENEA